MKEKTLFHCSRPCFGDSIDYNFFYCHLFLYSSSFVISQRIAKFEISFHCCTMRKEARDFAYKLPNVIRLLHLCTFFFLFERVIIIIRTFSSASSSVKRLSKKCDFSNFFLAGCRNTRM